MQPHYSMIAPEYVMEQESAFLHIYPKITKPESAEFGSKAVCRVLQYPDSLIEESNLSDDESLLPLVNRGNSVVVGRYNIIIMDDGFICGDNNLIIGCHNTIKGVENIVLGSANYYMHHDMNHHTDDDGLTAVSTQIRNFMYRVPTSVLEQFKFAQLAAALKSCNAAEDYNFTEAKVHLKAFYQQIQDMIIATPWTVPVVAATRRRTRQPPSYRSEPYHLRSGDTTPLPPAPVLPFGTIMIAGVILEWLKELINGVQYEDMVDEVDVDYIELDTFFTQLKAQHEIEQEQDTQEQENHPSNSHSISITIPSNTENGLLINMNRFLMDIELIAQRYLQGRDDSSDDDEGPPTEHMLPPHIESEPAAADDADKCIICETRAVSTELVPCGHRYSCVTCVHHPSMARTCALCREPFERIIPHTAVASQQR